MVKDHTTGEKHAVTEAHQHQWSVAQDSLGHDHLLATHISPLFQFPLSFFYILHLFLLFFWRHSLAHLQCFRLLVSASSTCIYTGQWPCK